MAENIEITRCDHCGGSGDGFGTQACTSCEGSGKLPSPSQIKRNIVAAAIAWSKGDLLAHTAKGRCNMRKLLLEIAVYHKAYNDNAEAMRLLEAGLELE